jgi:hypothetical protein
LLLNGFEVPWMGRRDTAAERAAYSHLGSHVDRVLVEPFNGLEEAIPRAICRDARLNKPFFGYAQKVVERYPRIGKRRCVLVEPYVLQKGLQIRRCQSLEIKSVDGIPARIRFAVVWLDLAH